MAKAGFAGCLGGAVALAGLAVAVASLDETRSESSSALELLTIVFAVAAVGSLVLGVAFGLYIVGSWVRGYFHAVEVLPDEWYFRYWPQEQVAEPSDIKVRVRESAGTVKMRCRARLGELEVDFTAVIPAGSNGGYSPRFSREKVSLGPPRRKTIRLSSLLKHAHRGGADDQASESGGLDSGSSLLNRRRRHRRHRRYRFSTPRPKTAWRSPSARWVMDRPWCSWRLLRSAMWSSIGRKLSLISCNPWPERFRFVWFDWRGTGSSERDHVDFSMEAMLRDLDAVVAASGVERFALSSVSAGVLIAVTYAATHPERISHLVLADGWVKWSDVKRLPAWQAEKGMRGEDWEVYTDSLAEMMWGIHNAEFARMLGAYLRECVKPEAHHKAFAAWRKYDVSDVLSGIAAPTLVRQNQDPKIVSMKGGQRLAGGIHDARLVPVADITYAGLPAAIQEFILPETAPAGTGD